MPPAAAVLRRAILIWGLGHLHLGDRRGWLLVVAHVVALSSLLLVGPALIQGTRWIVLFPGLLFIVLVWVAQAIHAHQRAVDLGGAGGGELQVTWLLPLIVLALTAFWLVGGQHASPAATLQQYVAAWRADRPAAASRLFHQTVSENGLSGAWQSHERHLRERVAVAASTFGAFSGLDPSQPFDGLRFVEVPEQRGADSAVFAIEITRRQRIETTIFGILPTATQQTVVVERVGIVVVRAYEEPPPPWLPSREFLPSSVWLVEDVQLPVGQPLRQPTT